MPPVVRVVTGRRGPRHLQQHISEVDDHLREHRGALSPSSPAPAPQLSSAGPSSSAARASIWRSNLRYPACTRAASISFSTTACAWLLPRESRRSEMTHTLKSGARHRTRRNRRAPRQSQPGGNDVVSLRLCVRGRLRTGYLWSARTAGV